jgi:glycolate oxidase
MRRIVEVDVPNHVAVVQPGVLNADLKKAAEEHGLFYAPDPASYEFCTIGGNIGTNAGGLCCVKYGVTRDSVLSLEVVLADGSIFRTGGRSTKDVAGYDLTGLFVGSQGTLGRGTEATMRLRPMPSARATLLSFFDSVESAGEAVATMTATGLDLCTIELMDRVTICAVDDWHNLGLDRTAGALLLIESDLPGAGGEDAVIAAAGACEAAGARAVIRALDHSEADWLRQVRRLAYRALERLGTVRMEDVGAPRSHMPELLRTVEKIAAKHNLFCGTFGHAGDGNIHPTFVWTRGDSSAAHRVQLACEDLYRAAISLGGTLTGEHGVGATRSAFLDLQLDPTAIRVMSDVKRALDPVGILNPGKIFAMADDS